MAIEVSLEIKHHEETLTFSLRRCEPYQVQRDSLNSLQNTPKAAVKVMIIFLESTDVLWLIGLVLRKKH